ncbi:hypothetical protein NL529_34390, partial [Klebsiella pneumoniae]|nr:hypothetical protein [Klebsiella pneumoniae]
TVTLTDLDGHVRFDAADPSPGWSWTLTQSSADELTVTFTDGARTLAFVASVAPDGSVRVDLTETGAAAVPPADAPIT